MITFRVTKIRWDDDIIGVQGELCINGNCIMPGQVITVKREDFAVLSFDSVVSDAALELVKSVPQDIISLFEKIDPVPYDITVKGKPKTVVEQIVEQDVAFTVRQQSETLLDKIRRRIGK